MKMNNKWERLPILAQAQEFPVNENLGSVPIFELIRWTTKEFSRHGLDSPRLDAELLLSHILGCGHVDLYLRHDENLGTEVLGAFLELVHRRTKREPTAYITGQKAFREIELKVSPAVMIPRPETEILVDAVISCLEKIEDSGGCLVRRVLDLGTGSGTIALSLARVFPELDIWASDSSKPALDLARENARHMGLESRINFVQGDRFRPFCSGPEFDLIVSNPPYIPTNVFPSLMPEVRDFEPRVALDGGEEGLEFIFEILEQAPRHLGPSGWLWLEVGDDQAEQVIAAAGSNLSHRQTIKDYAGKPRVLGFKWERFPF
jgi:release factor glutamine methyltransferase